MEKNLPSNKNEENKLCDSDIELDENTFNNLIDKNNYD